MGQVGNLSYFAFVGVCVVLAAIGLTGCRKTVSEKALASTAKGSTWLKTQQETDGSFHQVEQIKVGLTALAAIAMMDEGLDENDPNVKRAVSFLAAQQQEDGSIALGEAVENYQTALSSIALRKTGNKAYDEAMQKAQGYLKGLQRGAKGDVLPDNFEFGGIGYGRRQRPDLSNTQFALEALRATELGADSETFQRALKFVQRCQNLKASNDQPWAGNDGGFVYYPGMSLANEKAGGNEPRHSYGSMTYAGLLSFAYCDVPRDDARVQAALGWLRDHWTLDENPGMGKQGLYYYYMVMAKALSAYNEKYLLDNKGRRHDWARELANKLIQLQQPEGYWINTNDRWMENNKALVTSYCVIALNRCKPFLAMNDE